MTYYAVESKSIYDIKHYGILGQKWGIRRYQNPDGSLTPEGKARYNKYKAKIDSATNEKSRARLTKKMGIDEDKYNKYKSKKEENERRDMEETKAANNRLRKVKMITESDTKGFKDKSPEMKRRILNATDAGLRALNKIGRDGFDPKEGITNADRDWFIWEDQTIGYFTVADLVVNQKKSKNEVKQIVKDSYKVYGSHYGEESPYGSWQIGEGFRGSADNYIDALYDELKK